MNAGDSTEIALTPEQIVMNQFDAFLASESLDPAWVAGWHSAIKHAAHALRRANEDPGVVVGQIWADNDRRERGRTIKILEITDRGGGPRARVQVLTGRRGVPVDPPRYTSIAVRRLRPNSTGYRLLSTPINSPAAQDEAGA